MITRTYKTDELEQYKYVVILSRYKGKILLSRHKERTTWETQGGHIEAGETPLEAAKRELYEESGAVAYGIAPLCDYWAGNPETNQGANGMVFVADIYELGEIPESEMAQVDTFERVPEEDLLTYPAITPVLFRVLEQAEPLEVNELIIDQHDYIANGSVFRRNAVRGIIERQGKLLLIHSKYGDHKFPGGGMKKGETYEQTLIREVQEETGFIVKKDSIAKGFTVHERRKGNPDDLMIMDSYYYFCEVEEEAGERNLDDYEAEYDYQVCYMTLQDAIAQNESVTDYSKIPWTQRETMAMKKLAESRNR